MKRKFEAIGKQLLNHDLPLLPAGCAFAVGLPVDIVFVRLRPGGKTNDLLGLNVKGKGDDLGERLVDNLEAISTGR